MRGKLSYREAKQNVEVTIHLIAWSLFWLSRVINKRLLLQSGVSLCRTFVL